MRLITYIQTCHQISRRAFVALVNQGYVTVNGKIISSYTQEIHEGDKLDVQGPKVSIHEIIHQEQRKKTLILLNKPVGYVASKSDPHNKTIYELLPPEFKNYYYIGRLDKDSHGLLLLTDDPALVNEYEHPKHGIEKEYIVELDRSLHHADLKKAIEGVRDEDEVLKTLKITLFKKPYHYDIVLNEGKKRHIRRLFRALGYRVMDLQRIREGKYVLGDIKLGGRKIVK